MFEKIPLFTYERITTTVIQKNYEEKERNKKQAKETVDHQLAQITDVERGKILSLLKELFPQIDGLYSNIEYAGNDRYKKWHQQKRLCSSHHFDRYFTYSVIEGQISDVIFQDLLSMLTTESLDEAVNYFEKELTNLDISDFVFKLRFYEGSFLPQPAAQLARIIARLGTKFYVKNDLVFSIEGYTVDFIRKCIALQTGEDRGKFASELVELISPLGLALSLHNVLWVDGRRDDGNEHVLNSEQLILFEQTLIKRLLSIDSVELITSLEEDDLRRLFHAWIKHGHDTTELSNRANHLLDEDANFSLKIISIMAPTIYSTRLNKKEPTRDRIKSELSEVDYRMLQNIVSIDKLYQSTLTQFGTQTYIPDQSGPYPELSDNKLIGQFQQMYCQQTQGS